MKRIALFCLIMSTLFFAGCFEDVKNGMAKNGGLITSKGDYIILNTSGNIILDIYKLKNRFVNNQTQSDGVGFVDNEGNYILIQGDVKVIRVKNENTWNKFKEYHYENDFLKSF